MSRAPEALLRRLTIPLARRPASPRAARAAALGAALLVVAVAPARVAGQRPAILDHAALDADAGVNFRAYLTPDTVWVGQQITYQVGVFLDDEVRTRLRRNPEFQPPELRSMLAYDLPTHHSFVRRGEGPRYEAHVFQRGLFPLVAGQLEIPAATLAYALPLSRSFFSREESFTRRTAPLAVTVRALPTDGRPAGFAGAVGRLTMSARLDSAGARVGDPLRLLVRVSGTGNVNLLPRPALRVAWGHVTATRDTVRVETPTAAVQGWKEFEWLITPRRAGSLEVPAIAYPYFDPDAGEYAVARTPAIAVAVAPGALVRADGAEPRAAALPVRTAWRGAAPPAPADRPLFWALAALAPLPLFGLLAQGAWRRRPRRRIAPGAQLRRLAEAPMTTGADAALRAREVRRAFTRHLTHRLALPPVPLAAPGELAWLLRRAGVSDAAALEADAVLRALEHAAYADRRAATSPGDVRALAARAAAVATLVDQEASRRPLAQRALAQRRGTVALPLLALAAGLAGWAQAQGESPAERFARGVAAYQRGDARRAGEHFAAAAAAEPRAPDAWANYGTAAWAASDTAAAVVGWQRALRLEPAAGDLRARLVRVSGASAGDIAGVPAVPPAPVQWGALAAWVALALTLAWAARRRHPAQTPLLLGSLALLVAGGAASAWLGPRLRVADLAVVAEAGGTRALPALGSDPAAGVVTGELVRVTRDEGAWLRIETDRGAAGWLERDRLRPLAGAPAPLRPPPEVAE